uniref:GDSL esterase/lipase At5g55050 n=1 Tax=Anthurium amnicola TaxID=1678845 RepID=A0A1D1Y259_9ARAE
MACKSSPSLLSCLCLLLLFRQIRGTSVPAVFVFGDSTVDVGNNNYLPTLTRADFPHNGVDFPGGKPTGRFSNGFNFADYVAKKMGFPRSPLAFLSLTGSALRKKASTGVNFASAGSGILPTTGNGRVISMGEQVQQFEMVRANLTARFGAPAVESLLAESLFLFSTGSNDIFAGYAARGAPNTAQGTDFISSLASEYKEHLRALYKLGARKLGIVSVPPIGCCPSQRVQNARGGCLDGLNEFSQRFYWATKAVLAELTAELGNLSYALQDAYGMVATVLENPIPFGFKEVKSACCGGGRFNGVLPCLPIVEYCSHRKDYLFWDFYHPTQEASKLAAKTFYSGSQQFVGPMNLRQLVGNGNF